jgi:hypothetical protein
MLSACVERIAARRGSQRMHQHAARHWITGNHYSLPSNEVLSRLLLIPASGARRKLLQARSGVIVTNNAAGVSGALSQKDGLHAIPKESVIQR